MKRQSSSPVLAVLTKRRRCVQEAVAVTDIPHLLDELWTGEIIPCLCVGDRARLRCVSKAAYARDIDLRIPESYVSFQAFLPSTLREWRVGTLNDPRLRSLFAHVEKCFGWKALATWTQVFEGDRYRTNPILVSPTALLYGGRIRTPIMRWVYPCTDPHARCWLIVVSANEVWMKGPVNSALNSLELTRYYPIRTNHVVRLLRDWMNQRSGFPTPPMDELPLRLTKDELSAAEKTSLSNMYCDM
jgi:hypothetical protein